MRYERREAREAVRGHVEELAARRKAQLTQIRQEKPMAEHLTGSSQWNAFLQILEAWRQESLELQKSLERALSDPALLDHAQMIAIKMGIAQAAERAGTILQVMELPSELVDRGKKAAELLEAS